MPVRVARFEDEPNYPVCAPMLAARAEHIFVGVDKKAGRCVTCQPDLLLFF